MRPPRSRIAVILAGFLGVSLCGLHPSSAKEFSTNPYRSLLVNIDIGAGFDVSELARKPINISGDRVAAYTLGAFLIGVNTGFRFNEIVGIEAGWHDQQHRTHSEWGGRAHYTLGHLGLRLAWPLKSRQTPLLTIGPVVGQFSYGVASASGQQDNNTLVVGGMISLALEHELNLGLLTKLTVSYQPVARLGMDGILVLEETSYTSDGYDTRIIGSKDFTDDRFVQILWICVGFQFEWTFL